MLWTMNPHCKFSYQTYVDILVFSLWWFVTLWAFTIFFWLHLHLRIWNFYLMINILERYVSDHTVNLGKNRSISTVHKNRFRFKISYFQLYIWLLFFWGIFCITCFTWFRSINLGIIYNFQCWFQKKRLKWNPT